MEMLHPLSYLLGFPSSIHTAFGKDFAKRSKYGTICALC